MDYQAARQQLGSKLRELRVAKGLTQEGLAEAIGKTVEHISLVERGKRSPSFEILIDLAQALDVSPSVLLSGITPHSSLII
jgi:transcriptional regulator with XRE-family HTH domain